ncbi:MAG: glucose-6-phosphate dehydrogenase [Anaerorhabdus sp.]
MNGKKNCNITIFGSTGDLTYRKLMPALYHLYLRGKISSSSKIRAVGRRDFNSGSYHMQIKPFVKDSTRFNFNDSDFDEFSKLVSYHHLDFNKRSDMDAFCKTLNEDDNHLIYLAVAPKFFEVITDNFEMLNNKDSVKVVIEKPFGSSLENAKRLNRKLNNVFSKDNIYLIDHYLGKEMVQSIQTIRFSNPLFKDCWNYKYIEKVEIFAFELDGIKNRGSYYDGAGALKDMVQNHLLQILTIVALDNVENNDVYAAQMKVLNSIKAFDINDSDNKMVLGQYEGYLNEKDVAYNSKTETYARVTVEIDNDRWKGTPFIIYTGKKLSERVMEVCLTFKSLDKNQSNVLSIKIQPEEGVKFKFNIKKPGSVDEIISTEMDFCQSCNLEFRLNTPEAYERLIDECINSKKQLFSKWEQIEKSWYFVDNLRKWYNEKKLPLVIYTNGSDGFKIGD